MHPFLSATQLFCNNATNNNKKMIPVALGCCSGFDVAATELCIDLAKSKVDLNFSEPAITSKEIHEKFLMEVEQCISTRTIARQSKLSYDQQATSLEPVS